MDLYLQFGWGMMDHGRKLIKKWGGGVSILSARDLTDEQLVSLSRQLQELGGSVLLDPQFYLPRSQHHRLTAHAYWPQDYETTGFAGPAMQGMMTTLAQLNSTLQTTYFIVPGERAEDVDELWLDSQRDLINTARRSTDQPLMVTICLSDSAVRDVEQISRIMDEASERPVDAYYLVLEKPRTAYLTDDPVWVARCLDLAAGLRRTLAEVVVGYSNHQQLVMACSGVTAIASGTYANVRSFPLSKFQAQQGRPMQRAVWYYYPQALSEYRLPYLDIAFRKGLREELLPQPETGYAEPLFAGSQPSASGWSEPQAFRHYLCALRQQARGAVQSTFDATLQSCRATLDRAEALIQHLGEHGVYAERRTFAKALLANRSGLNVLEQTQGPVLRHEWSTLA